MQGGKEGDAPTRRAPCISLLLYTLYPRPRADLASDDDELQVGEEDDDDVGEGFGEGGVLLLQPRQDDCCENDDERDRRYVEADPGQAPRPLQGTRGRFQGSWIRLGAKSCAGQWQQGAAPLVALTLSKFKRSCVP